MPSTELSSQQGKLARAYSLGGETEESAGEFKVEIDESGPEGQGGDLGAIEDPGQI